MIAGGLTAIPVIGVGTALPAPRSQAGRSDSPVTDR